MPVLSRLRCGRWRLPRETPLLGPLPPATISWLAELPLSVDAATGEQAARALGDMCAEPVSAKAAIKAVVVPALAAAVEAEDAQYVVAAGMSAS